MEEKIIIPEGYKLVKTSESEYKIVKKEPELPNSWEEFCETHKIEDNEYKINNYSDIVRTGLKTRSPIDDRSFLPNKEYAESILALCQLIQLRDCYRRGWKPDWRDCNTKYIIDFFCGDLQEASAVHIPQHFAFQSEEIRDKFFENFKDLIEKTKPLFM